MVMCCADGVLTPPDAQCVIYGKVPVWLIEAYELIETW